MKNLKALREQQGMTQQEMADMLGIQRPTYTRYENGERQPSLELIVRIAKFFNVSTDYLLGKNYNPLTTDEQLDGVTFALHGAIDHLTEQKKKDLLKIVEYMNEQGSEDD